VRIPSTPCWSPSAARQSQRLRPGRTRHRHRPHVDTNEFLQTNYPNIYAAGDVAGPFQFTHTAAHQAWYAAVNALFDPLQEIQGRLLGDPWATFVEPEVARVGLNEQEAKAKGIPTK
jgi:pyruvate/2-oxoglutarate dehydrogenase complex dihydrolipoamide dehydrogenase (E3) component